MVGRGGGALGDPEHFVPQVVQSRGEQPRVQSRPSSSGQTSLLAFIYLREGF